MPIVVQPILRQLQKAMESNGLIQARNSVERNQFATDEGNGKALVSGIEFWVLRGTVYTSPISGA